MNKTIAAIAIGALTAGAAYYGWCSMQWKDAAEAPAAQTESLGTLSVPAAPSHQGRFTTDGVVSVDARLGEAYVRQGSGTMHTSVLVKASQDHGAASRMPANVVLVIDRSGSMSGERIEHARASALFLLDQLADGDRFSIVTYASNARVDFPSSLLNSDTRGMARASIDQIHAGGGTCISCGLDAGELQLAAADMAGSSERVIVISDGKAGSGVTSADGLGEMARRLEAAGSTVSSVGVGLDYNENVMAAIAQRGNGNHYFVEDPSTLAVTLEQELDSLSQLVAQNVRLSFELQPGVRFVQGYDRDFEVVGNRVHVSLGAMPMGREKTVLMELAYNPTQSDTRPIADVSLSYLEARTREARSSSGELSAAVTDDTGLLTSGRDGEVAARLEQVHLARAMNQANELIVQGRFDEADQVLDQQIAASSANNADFGSGRLKKRIKAVQEMQTTTREERARPGGKRRAAKGNMATGSILVD